MGVFLWSALGFVVGLLVGAIATFFVVVLVQRPVLRQAGPAWVPCACGEFVCRIHGGHVCDCPCPPIEEWLVDPYVTGGPSENGSDR